MDVAEWMRAWMELGEEIDGYKDGWSWMDDGAGWGDDWMMHIFQN